MEKKPLDDFGEKIGGARKDWMAGGISAASYDEMNRMEREKYATRDQIWPTPKWKELVSSGIPVELAFRIKCLRETIPAYIPMTGWGTQVDPENFRRSYVEGVNIVRDSAMGCKTVTDFLNSTAAVYNSLPEVASKALKVRLHGQRRHLSTDAVFAQEESRHFWRFSTALMEATGAGFPEPKKVAAKNSRIAFPERELAENPTRDKMVDYRKGLNATPDMFMETFALRGGEFGNWVDQDERQRSLNMAFDAFCDLADTMEIPKSQIGLNGTLSLAFGARGTGGRGAAAAHYECARRVINLTKPNGAGALCHEWFHALDHHLAAGNEAVRLFATDGKSLIPTNEGHAKSIKEALHVLSERDQSHEEARFEYANRLNDIRGETVDYISKVFKYGRAPITSESPNFALWTEIQERVRCGDIASAKAMVPIYSTTIESRLLAFNPPEKMVRFIDIKEAAHQRCKAVIDSDVYPHKIVKTSFYAKSRYWDDLRCKNTNPGPRKRDYYTLPHELTARAFEAYIDQSLSDRGAKNEYLVYGTKSSIYPIGEDMSGRLSAFGHTVKTAARAALGHEIADPNVELPAVTKALATRAPKTIPVIPSEESLERPERPTPVDHRPLDQGHLF